MRRAVANAVTTLLVAAVSAAAQQPVPKPTPATIDTAKDPHAAQPERPTVATHAGTVARGWFEIETGEFAGMVRVMVINGKFAPAPAMGPGPISYLDAQLQDRLPENALAPAEPPPKQFFLAS